MCAERELEVKVYHASLSLSFPLSLSLSYSLSLFPSLLLCRQSWLIITAILASLLMASVAGNLIQACRKCSARPGRPQFSYTPLHDMNGGLREEEEQERRRRWGWWGQWQGWGRGPKRLRGERARPRPAAPRLSRRTGRLPRCRTGCPTRIWCPGWGAWRRGWRRRRARRGT